MENVPDEDPDVEKAPRRGRPKYLLPYLVISGISRPLFRKGKADENESTTLEEQENSLETPISPVHAVPQKPRSPKKGSINSIINDE